MYKLICISIRLFTSLIWILNTLNYDLRKNSTNNYQWSTIKTIIQSSRSESLRDLAEFLKYWLRKKVWWEGWFTKWMSVISPKFCQYFRINIFNWKFEFPKYSRMKHDNHYFNSYFVKGIPFTWTPSQYYNVPNSCMGT